MLLASAVVEHVGVVDGDACEQSAEDSSAPMRWGCSRLPLSLGVAGLVQRWPTPQAPSIRPSRSALGLLHCADGLGLRGGRGLGVGGSGETGGSGVEHGAVDGLVELRDDPDAGVAVEDLDL